MTNLEKQGNDWMRAFKLKEHNQLKTISKAAAAKQNCQGIQSKNIAPYQN